MYHLKEKLKGDLNVFVGLLVLAMHIPLPNKGTIYTNDIKNHYTKFLGDYSEREAPLIMVRDFSELTV